MNKATVYITCIILLVVGSLPVAYPCILSAQKMFARWEMKKKLEREQLETIRVKASAVSWTFLKRECRIDGKMFDVKQVKEEGEYLRLTGLYDDKETEIENNISRNHSEDNKKLVTVMQAFAQAVTAQSCEPLLCARPAAIARDWQISGPTHIPTSIKTILTPPPES